MSDFLFYISLDRVCPEKRHATLDAVVTSRNNKIAQSAHLPWIPFVPLHNYPPSCSIAHRDREKFFKLLATTLARFSSRKSDPVGTVKFSRLAPHPARPSRVPLPSSRFAVKHSGGRASRKLFINVKTLGPAPFARSCCGVKGIHSPQLTATRTSFAEFPHETFARPSPALAVRRT